MEVNRVRIGTLTLQPLICHLSLLAIVLLSCTMIVNFSCAADETAELVACDYRPNEDDLVVRFCPNLDYTIVLECSLTKTYSLLWTLNNSETVEFHPRCNDSCKQQMKQGFNFSLIKMVINNGTNNNSYISQLRVSTSYLKNVVNHSNDFNVTCQSSVNNKRMSFIQISEGKNPQIVSAEFGESDEIIVTWISANNDLTRTEIVAEDENGTKTSVFTEWYKREGQINVTESSATYNVTVIEYTMCNTSFSSNTTRVNPSPVMEYTMCNTSFSSNTTRVNPSPVMEYTMSNTSFSSSTTWVSPSPTTGSSLVLDAQLFLLVPVLLFSYL